MKKTTKKDAYGRVIYKGPRGGKYIITGKKRGKPVNPVTKTFLQFLMKKH